MKNMIKDWINTAKNKIFQLQKEKARFTRFI